MNRRTLAFVVSCLIAVFCVASSVRSDQALQDKVLAVSVTVKAGFSGGCGTVFLHEDGTAYVLTPAHVVDGLRKVRTEIVDGTEKKVEEFEDAWVTRELVQEAETVAEVRALAEIVAYGEQEDVALLRVRYRGFFAKGAFCISEESLPQGTDLWVCGSPTGADNVLVRGVVSRLGRREAVGSLPSLIYDQTDAPAMGGSSGAGVFSVDSLGFAGMVTAGAGESFTLFRPLREIKPWLVEEGYSWIAGMEKKADAKPEPALAVKDAATP